MGANQAYLAVGLEPLHAVHVLVDTEPVGIDCRTIRVGEVTSCAVEIATDMGTWKFDPSRDVEALVKPEVAAGQELACMNGWDMRAAEAHRCCCCLVEVESTVEGTVQEGERAPQSAGLEVEVTGNVGSLQAHTPDSHRSCLTVSDEQIDDDLSSYGSLRSPLSPLFRGIYSTIAHAPIYQCTSRSSLPDLAFTHCEVADFHGQPHANERLPKESPVSRSCHA